GRSLVVSGVLGTMQRAAGSPPVPAPATVRALERLPPNPLDIRQVARACSCRHSTVGARTDESGHGGGTDPRRHGRARAGGSGAGGPAEESDDLAQVPDAAAACAGAA